MKLNQKNRKIVGLIQEQSYFLHNKSRKLKYRLENNNDYIDFENNLHNIIELFDKLKDNLKC